MWEIVPAETHSTVFPSRNWIHTAYFRAKQAGTFSQMGFLGLDFHCLLLGKYSTLKRRDRVVYTKTLAPLDTGLLRMIGFCLNPIKPEVSGKIVVK